MSLIHLEMRQMSVWCVPLIDFVVSKFSRNIGRVQKLRKISCSLSIFPKRLEGLRELAETKKYEVVFLTVLSLMK